MLDYYFKSHAYDTKILDDPDFINKLINNIKFILKDIDLKCNFISEQNMDSNTNVLNPKFELINNVIIENERIKKYLEAYFSIR